MQVKELGHLVLYVKDLARSRRFYGELLGWKEITPDRVPRPCRKGGVSVSITSD
jgi:catechol 2,3-dioxygenase